jgi:hypothetical protein
MSRRRWKVEEQHVLAQQLGTMRPHCHSCRNSRVVGVKSFPKSRNPPIFEDYS